MHGRVQINIAFLCPSSLAKRTYTQSVSYDGAWTLGEINLLRDLKVHTSLRQSFRKLVNSVNPLTLHCFKTQHSQPHALYPPPAPRCKSDRTTWRWQRDSERSAAITSADPSYPCTVPASGCSEVLYVFRGVSMQSWGVTLCLSEYPRYTSSCSVYIQWPPGVCVLLMLSLGGLQGGLSRAMLPPLGCCRFDCLYQSITLIQRSILLVSTHQW